MSEDKKRITVGFLIHHLDNDYSKAILKGAAQAAEENDVNLAVFPGRALNCHLDDRKYSAYEYQNNVIYSYVSDKTLDAAVVSGGTVGSFVPREEFAAFLKGFGNIPVVTTDTKIEGFPCIRLSSSGIKDVISHLITRHGKKKIAFVSGPAGNPDSEERLMYYKQALSENGIEFDERLTAHGNFSEYSEGVVNELLDRVKPDAICFANDMMCKGGYKAIEKRGLIIGEDIAVTGYDDSEIAVSLKPPLTTVRAEALILGKRAVEEAIRLAKGEKGSGDISLDSYPVYRASCGCVLESLSERIAEEALLQGNFRKAAEAILCEYIPQLREEECSSTLLYDLVSYTGRIFEIAAGKGCPLSEESSESARLAFLKIIEREFMKVISPEDIIASEKVVFSLARRICPDREENRSRREFLSRAAEDCLEIISQRMIAYHYSKMEEMTFTHFLISNITKDMTLSESDEEHSFYSIVNNLYRVHLDSCYIYTYNEPIMHSRKSEWHAPENIYLKAYHDKDTLSYIPPEKQLTPVSALLSNGYTPDYRRRTMVIAPLFMEEEQYGIMVYELDNAYFPFVYSITPQICTAIKLTKLVSQLETSLDAARTRNSVLNRMSMSDELTGIYNRRGFYINANILLRAPENTGRLAVLLYCDLDNLKLINDTFGHEEGDHAIIKAASFLKSSLRGTDVVGRMGGDEFAALAVCNDKETAQKLPLRIKSIAESYNKNSDKPYNVRLSIGTHKFTCAPELDIRQFTDGADSALYEDKKNKSRDIFKK